MKIKDLRFTGLLCMVVCAVAVVCGKPPAGKHPKQIYNKEEIIYHIFQRSFYDSNGDMQAI